MWGWDEAGGVIEVVGCASAKLLDEMSVLAGLE